MDDSSTTLLSKIVAGTVAGLSRRRFLAGVPVVAAAAAASCKREDSGTVQRAPAAADTSHDLQSPINSNSRLDTALVGRQHPSSSVVPGVAATDVAYHRYNPTLPPLAEGTSIHRVHWRAREVPLRISPSQVIAAWTFEGDIPGPILHVREGDTVEFTLTNEGTVPHSMDFHAAQIDPRAAFRSVPKGQSVTFSFKPRFAGAFMYHCGTAPVLMHIGAGMYGAIIVSPRRPLPRAKDFVLVQSEYYFGDAANGILPVDYRKMAGTLPDHVVFNGRPDQYIRDPIRVKVGDRVRFWVVSAGPTHPCHFHVVGEQFDAVYLASPPDNPLRGVQTFSVPPGGGMVFDIVADIPGEFPFVNHGFGHGQKGAIGFLVVEE
jgi:nitrite reductase (NO-forming)